jgi:hypothetical protein
MAVSPTATEADLLISNRTRARHHAVAERSSDVEDVMATVTSPEELTWSGSLCWCVNDTLADGSTYLGVDTSLADVRRFYTDWRDTELTVGTGHLLSDLRSPWYTFSDSIGTPLQNNETGKVRVIDSVVMFLTDGGDGISAEICWRRCEDVALTPRERTERWGRFLTALREQDVSALLALMSASAQAAVRDYVDADPPFVAVRGQDAMRAHYERLFERAEVIDITPVTSIIRDWFVFNELRWIVRLRSGPESGREVRFLTAEHMPFDSDGLFMARCGYGTNME